MIMGVHSAGLVLLRSISRPGRLDMCDKTDLSVYVNGLRYLMRTEIGGASLDRHNQLATEPSH